MQYTDHYNLNLPEGTDIVNPLVQDNPNYTAIDTALYANKLRVIGGASEVKTGTNHAITRSDTDINAVKFTATSNWIAGDTMTVDGVSVSVFLPDGSAPGDNSYVINTEVLMLINGTRVTLYSIRQDAASITYDNSNEDLAATNVQDAIDELEQKHEHITVNGTGATVSARLSSLLSTFTGLTNDQKLSSYLIVGTSVCDIDNLTTGSYASPLVSAVGIDSRVISANLTDSLALETIFTSGGTVINNIGSVDIPVSLIYMKH